MVRRPDAKHLARLRADAPDAPGVGLGEQAPVVGVMSAVAVLDEQPDRHPLDQLVKAALVVAGLVRGDGEIKPAHAGRPELPVDGRLRRAGIEEHVRAVTVLDQGGIALADVEKPDGELAGRRGRAEPGGGGEREGREHEDDYRDAERPRRAAPGGGPLGPAGTGERRAAALRARAARRMATTAMTSSTYAAATSTGECSASAAATR